MSAVRDWACYWLIQIVPGWRGGWRDRLFLALLPYAGRWAYRDEVPRP